MKASSALWVDWSRTNGATPFWAGLFAALEESVAAVRAAGEGARLQVSHLKAGAQAVWGRAGEAVVPASSCSVSAAEGSSMTRMRALAPSARAAGGRGPKGRVGVARHGGK